jgi:cyclopropane fatty-acyl-phospholipid synthase-like methyltransferase
VSLEQNVEAHMRKPYWGAVGYKRLSTGFQRLLELLESMGVASGNRLLELGGGSGWMAEFLAHCGYNIVSSTIAPIDVEIGNKRAQSFKIKNLKQELRFITSPMESIDEAVEKSSFDGVYVFEALHHAFDWRQTLHAAYGCLKNNGWFILCDEPNVLHTFISYRVAKLSHTHEIGFSRRQLVEELERCGFRKIKIFLPKWNNGITPHWIAAQK